MKKSASTCLSLLAAAILYLLPSLGHAQSFQGTVSYSIRLSGKGAQDLLINEPPTKMDMHVREDNYIITLSGGRITRTFLFIGDSSETYSIDATNRRAYRNTYFRDTVNAVPVATPTGKTMTIKGIACNEYELKKPQDEETVLYYVTDQYRVDMKLYEGKKDAKADFLTEGLEGRIPLRKVIKTPNVTTEIDMMSIKEKEHAPENFMIPAGFQIRKRDPRY